MLTFDEKEHRYEADGITVPSVTQILGEFIRVDIGAGWYVSTFTGQMIKADVFEAAGRMGTAIHDMIHYYLEDDLDVEALSPELMAVLVQFREWQDMFKPEIMHTEKRGYSEKYGFAGTMDLVCKIGRDIWIPDYKSGAYNTAGPQLAAYEKLYQESIDSHSPVKRAVLRLPKDGSKFKWVPMTDRKDWLFFQARKFQYDYLRKGR